VEALVSLLRSVNSEVAEDARGPRP
jgi:hypothetical protein